MKAGISAIKVFWGTLLLVAVPVLIFYVLSPQIRNQYDGVALCQHSPMDGVWINTNDTLVTNDVQLLEIDSTCSGANVLTTIRVETVCGRVPCKWQATQLVPIEAGLYKAVFRTFSANRSVILRPSGLLLGAEFEFDFHSPGRATTQQVWTFKRA